MLLTGIHLTECAAVAIGGYEHGVVAEPSLPPGGGGYVTLHRTGRHHLGAPGGSQHHDTTESSGAPNVVGRHTRQLPQELADVLGISCVGARVTG